MSDKALLPNDDPLWYKDAVIYQLHIKSYYDSNGDGIGDIQGLVQKLDYLESLGITAIWLLPFYPSPLRDDGYDIANYYNINPDYGTLRDFKKLLREAHHRNIRVIIELVINHTSDQHPWFQKARTSKPGSVWRNFYVWSNTPHKYSETRIIFQDFETSNWTWDPVANAYYWHRFYSHQPDLNFDNPRVQKEIIKILDFWLDMGVDGLRLDAVPYLYEREGTNCENLPETHDFLKKLRAHVDNKYENRMLLAEANQWPEDAAAYFGDGDECHTAFHFPVMPRLFMGLQMEDRFPITDILEQTPETPDICQWFMFLRNHDELTLEMVTDEERDFMYRVFVQDPRAKINLGIRRRLAPLLDNDRRKIELMNILLFSLTGTPVIYYGDEIGMGDNYYLGDRDGVRTPMQWSPDRNGGFSRTNPQKLYLPVIIDPEYHYEALNVENQEKSLSSLLWWMRHIIDMRKQFKAFGRGSLEFLYSDNPKVLVFLRENNDEKVLIVANLSKHAQVAEFTINSSDYAPIEVFSRNQFPDIHADTPYVIMLSPYGYYWLHLEKTAAETAAGPEEGLPELTIRKSWTSIFDNNHRFVKQVLPAYLKTCRWFGSKARKIKKTRIDNSFCLGTGSEAAFMLIVDVQFQQGPPESYFLPVSFLTDDKAESLQQEFPQSIIAHLKTPESLGILYDSIYDPLFRQNLLEMMQRRKRVKGKEGHLYAYPGRTFKAQAAKLKKERVSRVLQAEQSNSSILYQDTFFLKLYRKLEHGINPDLEIEKYLSEKTSYSHIPAFAGAIEWKKSSSTISVGLLQSFIPNEGDAWSFMLNAVTRYFERVLARRTELDKIPSPPASLLDIDEETLAPLLWDLIEAMPLEMTRLLGNRTGELHNALALPTDDPDFKPEPFSTLYQRSLYQSIRNQARRTLQNCRRRTGQLSEAASDMMNSIAEMESDILNQIRQITQRKIKGKKIRIHGDYHLGQVLHTGKDFIVIDFEGEPAHPLSERRLKRSALRDVAGMVRSFHYAAYSPLLLPSMIRDEDAPELESWAHLWYTIMSALFVKGYREAVAGRAFVPEDPDEFKILLHVLLLEKAIYELGYELNNRPDWLTIPVKGINYIVKGD